MKLLARLLLGFSSIWFVQTGFQPIYATDEQLKVFYEAELQGKTYKDHQGKEYEFGNKKFSNIKTMQKTDVKKLYKEKHASATTTTSTSASPAITTSTSSTTTTSTASPTTTTSSSSTTTTSNSQNPCTSPLHSAEEAERCLKHQFIHEHETLYNFAKRAGHLGDVSDCSQSTKPVKSYFSSERRLFSEMLNSLINITCKPDPRDNLSYYCQSIINSNQTLACSKGKTSTKAAWMIGKTSGKLVTFFIN